MAKKISELPADTSLGETAVIPAVDGGVTSKITTPNLRKAMIDPTSLAAVTSPSDASVMEVTEASVPSKVSIVNLRKSFTGYISSTGEQLISEDWPVASITYNTIGDIDTITFTGPTGAWTYVPHYDATNTVDYVTITSPGAAASWRQTITYTGTDITAVSAWIIQ